MVTEVALLFVFYPELELAEGNGTVVCNPERRVFYPERREGTLSHHELLRINKLTHNSRSFA
jgi:hypothetical protein